MRARDQRGVVLPSPVVILSVIAVAMAAVAFLFTRDSGESEREITPAARTSIAPSPSATTLPSATPTRTPKPAIKRQQIYVEVYNNSAISGLAAKVAATAGDAGWNVVGADNWYGTIPTTTVYFPPRLARAAKVLATDLGIRRTAPAVDPMRMDRLTVILTAPLS